MSTRLWSIVIDAADPDRLARFWSAATGWPIVFDDPDDEEAVVATDRLGLLFVPVPEAKSGKNRIHLDLPSMSTEHQAAEVARLRELGATPIDVGQRDVPWVVLADPEGNELCVLDPRPEYADTGGVAAIVVDCVDPTSLGRFWREAAGMTLVDAHEGGAWVSLRAPDGGGPFLELLRTPEPPAVKNRIHLDVAPFPEEDQATAVERLRQIGAEPVDIGQGDVSWVVLADPDGQEFCVLTPRGPVTEIYGSLGEPDEPDEPGAPGS